MRVILVLFIILSSSLSRANSELDWLTDLPSYIDKIINSNTQQKRYCEVSEASSESITANPHQKCLEIVCGSPDTFTSSIDLWIQDYSKVVGGDTEELKKTPMGKVLTEKVEEFYKEDPSRIGDEEKKKIVLEMVNKPLENMQITVHGPSGFLVAFEGFNVFNHGGYNEETGKYEVKDSIYDGATESKKIRLKTLKASVEKNINSPLQQFRSISAQEFIKQKYPDIDFKSGILLYIDELARIETKYLNNIGGLLPFPIDLTSIKSRVEQNDISSVELDIMIQEASSIELFGSIFDHQDMYGNEISKEVEAKLKNWFNTKNTDELKSLLEKKMSESDEEEKEDDKKRMTQRDKSLEVCLDSYNRNSNLFPDESTIQSLNTTVANSKKKFIAKILNLNGLSTKSKDHIKSQIEEVRFKLPYSKDTYKNVLTRSINNKLLNNKKTKEALAANLDMKSLFTFFTYTVAFPDEMGGDDDDEEEESDGDIAEICQRLEQEAFSDATYTAFGEIMLSYTLAKAPQYYQEQVIFHELGHNLERIFRESSISQATLRAFQVTESCIGDIEKTVVGNDKHTQYFSEDFADWIAYKVEDDFLKPKGCEYLSFDSASGFYKDKSIFNEHEDDPHSSNIFRMLRYYVDNDKELPKECSDPLIGEGILGFEKKCAFETNVQSSH